MNPTFCQGSHKVDLSADSQDVTELGRDLDLSKVPGMNSVDVCCTEQCIMQCSAQERPMNASGCPAS